jgi:hypothetical protein
MALTTKFLQKNDEKEYEYFLNQETTTLLYHSLPYRNFLLKIFEDAEAFYIATYMDGRIVGVLPSIIRRNDRLGNVINSLPFFGSNGGIITSHTLEDPLPVRLALLQKLNDLAQQERAVSVTVISNPLDNSRDFYEKYSRYHLRDERIGQILHLPRKKEYGETPAQYTALKAGFEKNIRRAIEKASKCNMQISHGNTPDMMKGLFDLHQDNIRSIGGIPKPWFVFEAIKDSFTYDKEYRIYSAEMDGQIIAALLVFFYNKTAEYFTPAISEPYRTHQPLSLIIFEAMKEAINRGMHYWNWGGTWASQSGVYTFKKRWGSTDYPYYYYIQLFSPVLRTCTQDELLKEYPYFYVLPFNLLQQDFEKKH